MLLTGLATNSALSAVENKIPDVSSLVKKNILDIEIKVTNHDHDKYIATSEFNKLRTKFESKISANRFSNKNRF